MLITKVYTRKHLFLFIFLISIFLLLYKYYLPIESIDLQTTNNSRFIRENSLLILIWNPIKLKSWNSFPKSKSTDLTTCSRLCVFTDEKEFYEKADAVVLFAVQNTGPEAELPPVNLQKNQLRVFWLTEAPPFMQSGSSSFIKFPNEDGYNWTMTYRLDSDVPLAYSYLKRNVIPVSKPTKSFMAGKSKLIAWTVSHCTTQSRREELTNELNKFVPVDIYGDCGQLKCSTGNSRTPGGQWDLCYKELGAKYKFYLSLENSLCTDYVTEKFWYALESGMVPIVYGGANYSLMGPPKSFINVEDFNSIKELAQYLNYLDQNDEKYLKYFEWRKLYTIYRKDRLCSLCEKMYELAMPTEDGGFEIDPNYRKHYLNISTWWNYVPAKIGSTVLEKVCRPPVNFTTSQIN